MIVHATALAVGPHAVLLRGPSGAGKSDLALRMLALPRTSLAAFGFEDIGPVRLVADDRVRLETRDGGASLWAVAPDGLPAAVEVRGIGLVPIALAAACRVALMVDLVAREAVERMPEPEYEVLCGVSVKRMMLDGRDASAPLKLALMVLGVPMR